MNRTLIFTLMFPTAVQLVTSEPRCVILTLSAPGASVTHPQESVMALRRCPQGG
jgi:hypothetical protein